MSDSRHDRKPKTQSAPAGGPPRPPKKTARGLEDEPPPDDPLKVAKAALNKLSASDRAEIKAWLEKFSKTD